MSITIPNIPVLWLRVALIAVFAIVIIAVAFVAWFVRSPLPKQDGIVTLAGLSAPVTIRRDERGTPHIEARTADDALFAEGFACAQDRLWQMDTLRREAEGRLSEIAGPATFITDRYFRTLGLGAAAEADARKLDPKTLAALEVYAAGVNAEATSHPLPIEFSLIGYGWEPWKPKDTLAIAKLMAQRLDDQWYYLDVRARLNKTVGVEAATALTDMQLPQLEQYIPGYAPSGRTAFDRPSELRSERYRELRSERYRELRSERYTNDVAALLQNLPDWPRHERDTGSNNWMVAGARTSTGKPVLSNDTHLEHSLPSTWWIADLRGGDLHVAGFTLPGVPGIILGHNEHIAFGVTSAEEAVQDLYIERFRSGSSDEYIADGYWLHAQHRIERVRVKGQRDIVLDVLVTRHGPVIERAGTRAIALAWTILRGGGESRAVLGYNTASNFQQFRDALAYFVGPVLNFGYADVDGHIGYQDAGVVPLRAHGDGSLPVEGQDDYYAWLGAVPFDTLPHALDPAGGFVVTANQALVPPSFRPILSTYFETPLRARRIATLLMPIRGAGPVAIGAIQGDAFDYARLRLARATANALTKSTDPAMRRIGAQLAKWNGMMDVNAKAPTFVIAEAQTLFQDLYLARLGPELFADYEKHYAPIVPVVRVIGGDMRMRAMGITPATLNAFLARAAQETAVRLHATGDDGIDALQTWGTQNAAIYEHPLSSAKWFLQVLNVPVVRQPGSGLTVYAGKPDHGPSQRLVVDLSNFDNSSMLLTLGESGLFSDSHYDDQMQDFADVRWAPLPFSDAAVQAATQHTLILEPALKSAGLQN